MSPTQFSSTTSLSLLQGMRERDPVKWERFARIYSPLVYGWCRRAALQEHDAADVAQEVFRAVATQIDTFRRDRPGDSFRGWLWTIGRHKIQDHFRRRRGRPEAIGGSTAHAQLHEIPHDVPEAWSEEQQSADDQRVFHRALELIRGEFEDRTWQAFWRVVVQEHPPAVAATDLGMSVGAVYNAKYKVLHRLRQEFDDLM